MLNEEKVILMTKLASYEAKEEKKNIAIGNFFRSDYISLQMIKSLVCGTIAFGVLFGLYILYDFENFMNGIYKIDIIEYAMNVLGLYFVFILVYVLISYIVFSIKYKKAKQSLKCYQSNLKKLSAMYDKDRKTERK